LVGAAVIKRRPEIGTYQPGFWAMSRASEFLGNIGESDRTAEKAAELRSRITAFAASSDPRFVAKSWSFDVFAEGYGALSKAATRATGPPPGEAEKYRDRPYLPRRKDTANGAG
jgi:hypothetical protein